MRPAEHEHLMVDRVEHRDWHRVRPHRRRVSRLRWWVGLTLLAAIAASAGFYFYVTDEARLRAYAERWLCEFTGGEVRIDRVYFDPFRGLDLMGVAVATPEEARFDPRDSSFAGRTVFRSGGLFLRLRPFSVISGNLVVPEILATDSEITLTHRLADDARNWQMLFGQRPRKPSRGPLRLPVIRLRNVRLAQYRLDERGRSGGAVQSLWAEAQPARDAAQLYDLRVTRVFESPDGESIAREEGRIELNLRTLAVAGSLPSMSVDDLAYSAPARALKWLEILGLKGFVRAESLRFDPAARTEGVLVLRDASFSVPVNETEEGLPAPERYIRFGAMAGTVRIDGERAHVNITGRFRESPITIRGQVYLGDNRVPNLEQMGFDLHVSVTGADLPTNDDQSEPAERRFVQRWFHLREFVADYDGRGKADLAFHLQKEPGKEKGIRFVEGTLSLRGPSGRYFRFPYRVYELTGDVYFRPDGRIELRDLAGVHGRSRVRINGLVDGYISQGFDVEVQAESVELDDDLRRCLEPADQELIRKFNAQARTNLDLRLHRDRKPHGVPVHENPWRSAVDVEFIDGEVCFAGFPYPLSQVTGRMKIEDGRFDIRRVRATRGDAVVEMSGQARRPAGQPAEVDLNLIATNVPLDDALAVALPAEARPMYAAVAPSGKADLAGRLFTDAGGEVRYDLSAELRAGMLTLPETRARLTEVEATIHLLPESLEIPALAGRLGESPVRLQGVVGTAALDSTLAVRFSSDRLVLNDGLRAALPEAVQPFWQTVQPEGPVRVELEYARQCLGCPTAGALAGPGSLLATALTEAPTPAGGPPGTGQPWADYTAVIEPLGASAKLEAFPLPLTDVRGWFQLTPAGIRMENVAARYEQTRFEVGGQIELLPDGMDGDLSLTVRDLAFTEPLRKAVPWRMRRLWNDVRPGGGAHLFIHRLVFSRRPEGNTWSINGHADLDNFSIHAGSELTEINGRVTGSGGMGAAVSIDAEAALTQLRVDGRLVTGAQARVLRPEGEPKLRISGFQGQFYDGVVAGDLEVDYAPARPNFGLSLIAREVSLDKFLNAKRVENEPPVQAKGLLEGRLALTGRFNDPSSRRGGGAVFIRKAEMFKVPLVLAILQVVNLAIQDNNAFTDARLAFAVDGDELLLDEIDLRGRSFSMVGAGRVQIPTETLDLTLLVGSPLKLPRMEVLTELVEGVARELVEVHVEGTLEKPAFRTEMVRSVKSALDEVFNARRRPAARR